MNTQLLDELEASARYASAEIRPDYPDLHALLSIVLNEIGRVRKIEHQRYRRRSRTRGFSIRGGTTIHRHPPGHSN